MTDPTYDTLIQLTQDLKEACERIGEAGYNAPYPAIFGVPRVIFDMLPSVQRVECDLPDDPSWSKSFKGITYTCWEAPEVGI